MARKITNKLACLPQDVTITRIVEHPNCDELYVESLPTLRCCPKCGSHECVIKDSGRQQTIRHTAISNRGTLLTFFKRRFRCKSCKATYYENPEWAHSSLHVSMPLYYNICLDLTELLSVAEIARRNCVTESIVSDVLDTLCFNPPEKLPETLCIDEFKGDSGEWNPEHSKWDVNKFHCNISDGKSGVILDILPQIDAAHLKEYFSQYTPSEKEQVKYFCCDMHNGYVRIAKDCFPNATICIDLFHVTERLNRAVDEVRRRLQNELRESDSETYELLKHTSYLLKTREDRQDILWKDRFHSKQKRLEAALDAAPDLRIAYDALQLFHHINSIGQFAQQRAALSDWIRDYTSCEVPEVRSAAETIKHWRSYIQNSWKYSRSNGPCEGLNNKIKVLKRISFGVHSFERFRKRVLLTCGYIHLSHRTYTIFQEKMDARGKKVAL